MIKYAKKHVFVYISVVKSDVRLGNKEARD